MLKTHLKRVEFLFKTKTPLQICNSAAAVALSAPCGTFKILKAEDEKLRWSCPEVAPDDLHQQLSPEARPDTSLQIVIPQPDPLAAPVPQQQQQPEKQLSFELNTTIESEKPSDTSLLSDTPLDEIVSAELHNLVSKSGISDFVTPPFADQNFHADVEMELGEVKQDDLGFENHQLVGAPHEVDFEALSEEFNRNTQA